MASNYNSAHEKGPLPSFTIVDSADKQSSNKNKFRRCCICFPERTGIVVIFAFYLISGFLTSISSFFYLADSFGTLNKTLLAISGILYGLMFVSGVLGLSFIRKDNAVMMYKMSIVSWILTVLILIYNLTVYIFEVAFRSSSVQRCEDNFSQDPSVGIDCNQVVDIILVKDALKIIFVESFSFYFSYVIYRYSKRMLEGPKETILPYGVNPDNQAVPPYAVYVTRPPTSYSWVPPPTYTIRANEFPSDAKNASVPS